MVFLFFFNSNNRGALSRGLHRPLRLRSIPPPPCVVFSFLFGYAFYAANSKGKGKVQAASS
jgi:hypothetical protein